MYCDCCDKASEILCPKCRYYKIADMIIEDYVSFEIAKLLKEKGFKGDTSCYYTQDNSKRWIYQHYHDFDKKDRIECPTVQMAMKWLREKHYKSIEVRSQGLKATSIGWVVEIFNLVNQDEEFHHPYTFPTYEEACEAAIKYCLKNLI